MQLAHQNFAFTSAWGGSHTEISPSSSKLDTNYFQELCTLFFFSWHWNYCIVTFKSKNIICPVLNWYVLWCVSQEIGVDNLLNTVTLRARLLFFFKDEILTSENSCMFDRSITLEIELRSAIGLHVLYTLYIVHALYCTL